MANRLRKQPTTKKTPNFGQFFPVSWALKLVFELWKIPEILSKFSPPGLLSAV